MQQVGCREHVSQTPHSRAGVSQTVLVKLWLEGKLSLPTNVPVPSPGKYEMRSRQDKQPSKAGLPTTKGLLLSERDGKIVKINTLKLAVPFVRLNMFHSSPKYGRMSRAAPRRQCVL